MGLNSGCSVRVGTLSTVVIHLWALRYDSANKIRAVSCSDLEVFAVYLGNCTTLSIRYHLKVADNKYLSRPDTNLGVLFCSILNHFKNIKMRWPFEVFIHPKWFNMTLLCPRSFVEWITLVFLDTKASQSRIKAYCSLRIGFLDPAP